LEKQRSAERTFLMTVFHCLQQVRSVNVFQTFSIGACIAMISLISMWPYPLMRYASGVSMLFLSALDRMRLYN
jgi:hypothetical protein